MNHRPLNCKNPVYTHIIGTGGIGSGLFFLLEGNHTMTRNESRLGRQLPCRDYCKQHTILHYVSVLMGASSGAFEVHPIGMVGDDDRGWALLAEMDSVGMTTRGVSVTKDAATLFSVCFQYPDSTGGNITTSNGASCLLTAGDVAARLKELNPHGAGIVLAMPEVPLEARIALLLEGRNRGCFNAASFSAGEASGFAALGGLALADLLAVNREEAAALAGMEAADPSDTVKRCMAMLALHNRGAKLIVTDWPRGSWACCEGRAVFMPALPAVEPINAAGAGDTIFAGVLCGLACGLPFVKGTADVQFGGSPLDSAVEMGTLLASFTTTSTDTIHWGADARKMLEHARGRDIPLSDRFEALLH